jgi:hypothetical protein
MHPCRHEIETLNNPAMLAAVSKPCILKAKVLNSISNDDKEEVQGAEAIKWAHIT